MNIHGSFKAVTPVDLYDFYGIASLDRDKLEEDQLSQVMSRLKEIQDLYLEALKTRFAHWSGKKDLTVRDMVGIMKDSLEDEIEDQAQQMAMGMSQGFNMMAAIKTMRGETDEAKKKAAQVNIEVFSKNLAGFNAADYPKIAQGVVDLFNAESASEIILAVDFLNDLQHCGGYILIDFVAGKRDPSNKFGNEMVKKILDLKRDAGSPLEFADEMSEGILEVVKTQYDA